MITSSTIVKDGKDGKSPLAVDNNNGTHTVQVDCDKNGNSENDPDEVTSQSAKMVDEAPLVLQAQPELRAIKVKLELQVPLELKAMKVSRLTGATGARGKMAAIIGASREQLMVYC